VVPEDLFALAEDVVLHRIRLSYEALAEGNPVGLMGVGSREMHHAPSLSRRSILQWLHQLRHFRFSETTTLGKRVRELIPRVEQRCLFVVISDLHDPDAIPAIKLMAHDHDCAVLHLEDPAERGAIKAGIFRAVEAETGAAFVAHGTSRFLDHEETHLLSKAGVDYLRLGTDEPIVPRLRHFLKNRKSSRRTG
jgi:uncharacterized protein (DUF58 family)